MIPESFNSGLEILRMERLGHVMAYTVNYMTL